MNNQKIFSSFCWTMIGYGKKRHTFDHSLIDLLWEGSNSYAVFTHVQKTYWKQDFELQRRNIIFVSQQTVVIEKRKGSHKRRETVTKFVGLRQRISIYVEQRKNNYFGCTAQRKTFPKKLEDHATNWSVERKMNQHTHRNKTLEGDLKEKECTTVK